MDAQTLASLLGIVIGYILITLKNDNDPQKAKDYAYGKAEGEQDGDNNSTLRNSVDAVLASANIADRLLVRIETLEDTQSKNEAEVEKKLSDMETKINDLTEDNLKKAETIKSQGEEIDSLKRKVELLRKKLFEETGVQISTTELDKLINGEVSDEQAESVEGVDAGAGDTDDDKSSDGAGGNA